MKIFLELMKMLKLKQEPVFSTEIKLSFTKGTEFDIDRGAMVYETYVFFPVLSYRGKLIRGYIYEYRPYRNFIYHARGTIYHTEQYTHLYVSPKEHLSILLKQ